jgi:hypothetical protein
MLEVGPAHWQGEPVVANVTEAGCSIQFAVRSTCENAPTSHAWLTTVAIPLIAAVSIILVAIYTAWHTGRRETASRRATSDAEALQALIEAALAYRAASQAVGRRTRPTAAQTATFDASSANFHVRVASIRATPLRKAATEWERVALKAHSLDPKTPLSHEHDAWEELLRSAGETAQELYKGKD